MGSIASDMFGPVSIWHPGHQNQFSFPQRLTRFDSTFKITAIGDHHYRAKREIDRRWFHHLSDKKGVGLRCMDVPAWHTHDTHDARTYPSHILVHIKTNIVFFCWDECTRMTHVEHTHYTRTQHGTRTPNTHTSAHQNETCVRILIEKTLPNAKICWCKWHWFWNVWPILLSYGSSYPISFFRREAVR